MQKYENIILNLLEFLCLLLALSTIASLGPHGANMISSTTLIYMSDKYKYTSKSTNIYFKETDVDANVLQLIEDEFISDFTLVWNFIRIKPELNSTGAGGVELAFALKCNLG